MVCVRKRHANSCCRSWLEIDDLSSPFTLTHQFTAAVRCAISAARSTLLARTAGQPGVVQFSVWCIPLYQDITPVPEIEPIPALTQQAERIGRDFLAVDDNIDGMQPRIVDARREVPDDLASCNWHGGAGVQGKFLQLEHFRSGRP